MVSNERLVECVWATIDYYKNYYERPGDYYKVILEECINNILKLSLLEKSEDNVTAIIVCFRNLLTY